MEVNSYRIVGSNVWAVVITVGALVISVLTIEGVYLKKVLKDTPLQMLGENRKLIEIKFEII